MAEFTTTLTKEQLYRDLSLTFARNPVTHDVAMVTGPDAIKRSLQLLLLMEAGETPFYSSFGSNLRGLLFEPIDNLTTTLIENEIRATIDAYEPRVQIQSLTVTPSEDESQYQVTLVFSVLMQTQTITLSLFLSRLR